VPVGCSFGAVDDVHMSSVFLEFALAKAGGQRLQARLSVGIEDIGIARRISGVFRELFVSDTRPRLQAARLGQFLPISTQYLRSYKRETLGFRTVNVRSVKFR
jgi:hypothetical protein